MPSALGGHLFTFSVLRLIRSQFFFLFLLLQRILTLSIMPVDASFLELSLTSLKPEDFSTSVLLSWNHRTTIFHTSLAACLEARIYFTNPVAERFTNVLPELDAHSPCSIL